jgi:predicted MFS family arabinose efflux permease
MNCEAPPPRPAIPLTAFVAATAVELTTGLVINALPAIVSALTDAGRLDAEMTGYVVGIDLGAQVAGGVLFLGPGRRRRLSTSFAFGLALVVVGNALSCLSVSTPGLIATRLVAGLGAGAVRSAYFALLSFAASPSRAVARLTVAQIVVMSGAFAIFPLLTHRVGWYGPYLFLSVLGAAMFATIAWWPRKVPVEPAESVSLSFGSAGVICLMGVFLYWVAQDGLWAFAEAIGVAMGQSRTAITTALSFVGIPGGAASLLAYLVAPRISTPRALTLGLCLTLVSLYLLTVDLGAWTLLAGLGLFYFAWCATAPFAFAAAVECDPKRNTASAFIVAVGIGVAVGPACAGNVVQNRGTLTLLALTALCTTASIALLLLAVAQGKRLFGIGADARA